MMIIGELINASRKDIGAAIKNQDSEFIKKIAREECEAGADFIDVNAGIFVDREPEYLKWLVMTVQQSVDAPCALDSPNPKAIQEALTIHKGIPMINSISLEIERFEKLIPLIAGTDFKVVALCMSDEGMPETTEQRLSIADKLINKLTARNIPIENIYLDPLVQPISTNTAFGIEFLEAIEKISETFKGAHTICGLSNISYGLPARKLMNQVFAIMAITKGLDSLILNPLDRKMMANITIAETLLGKDEFCMKYLKSYRSGLFDV